MATIVILGLFDVCVGFVNTWMHELERQSDLGERFLPSKNYVGWGIVAVFSASVFLLAGANETFPATASVFNIAVAPDAGLMRATHAIATALVLHAGMCAILTGQSGGASVSPYPAGLLLLPTLAVFLHVQVSWIAYMALFSLLIYVVLHHFPRRDVPRYGGPAVFMNAISFALSMITALTSMRIVQ